MDGSEAVSSLKSFKPRHEGVTVNEMRATLQDVEAAYQRDTAAKRAMRSKLDRSASSVRRERNELQNMLDFKVQQAAIAEEKEALDLNRKVDEMMKKQEEVALSEEELLSLGNLLFASKNLWPLMVVQAVVSEVWEGQDREEVMRAYGRLMQYVREKELMRMWEIPSIVNGNELVTYGVKKGPGMKDVMDAIRNWMILHPHGTKEECVHEVLSYPK